jgi:hypothetical protein
VLVVGLPRSGTTWFARALASGPNARYVHEPDNVESGPYARVGMRGLRHDPSLTPGERVPAYERMWDVAFRGGWPSGSLARQSIRAAVSRRVPNGVREAIQRSLTALATRTPPADGTVIVKSVYCYFAMEWLAQRYAPAIAIVWRNPANMLPGYLDRGWIADELKTRPPLPVRFGDTSVWPPPAEFGTENVLWSICARMTILLETAARHPDWHVYRHEDIAANPAERFRRVFDDLGLAWSPDVERFLERSNTRGSGWDVQRLAEEESSVWKRRLDPAQVRLTLEVMRRFADVAGDPAPLRRCIEELEAG